MLVDVPSILFHDKTTVGKPLSFFFKELVGKKGTDIIFSKRLDIIQSQKKHQIHLNYHISEVKTFANNFSINLYFHFKVHIAMFID